MLRLYNTALLPIRLGLALWSAWTPRDEARRTEWAERRALRLPSVTPGGAWIHGASVGEAMIVRGLARALRSVRPELPLAVSAYTTTGRAQLPAVPDVDAAFFVPLDFRGLAARVFGALRPTVLALVETELWPNMLHEAHAAGVAVVVLNGRLSPERMSRYRRLYRLYRPLLKQIRSIGAQSEDDARRWHELGVRPEAVTVTGNIKYDLPLPAEDPEELRRRLGLATRRPVLVAGSTAAGEDGMVLEAFERGRQAHPDLLLVLAPRHVTRADEVEQVIHARGLSAVRYSSRAPVGASDVLLVDTVGELASLYRLASVAFVGGSLVPIGGHNLLEPAASGAPVLYGPYTDHVREPAEALLQAGGGRRVRDAPELGQAVQQLLDDADLRRKMGDSASELVQANRGALERSIALLSETLEARALRSTPGVA
jgi:3-deoxy-D-manno-octulosonic-acid transferase